MCIILFNHHTTFKKAALCPFYRRKYCLYNWVTIQDYTASLEGRWILNLDLAVSRVYDFNHYAMSLTRHQMHVLNAWLTRPSLMWLLPTLQVSPVFLLPLFFSHTMPLSFFEHSMIFLTIRPFHKVSSSSPLNPFYPSCLECVSSPCNWIIPDD